MPVLPVFDFDLFSLSFPSFFLATFIFILIVSPSLNLKSSSCLGSSFSFSISSDFFSHLKWSWRATFKSKLSDLSEKPTPINADLPT